MNGLIQQFEQSFESESAVEDQVGKLNSLLSNFLGTFNAVAPSIDQLNDGFARTRELIANESLNLSYMPEDDAFSDIDPCDDFDSPTIAAISNYESLQMKLEDFRSQEFRNRQISIPCTSSDLTNLATYLECLAESGQAYGDFPALNLKFHVTDGKTQDFDESGSTISFASEIPRGRWDSAMSNYSQIDYLEIMSKVDTQIHDTLEEYNNDLEKKLNDISKELDQRRNTALPGQIMKDRIIKHERRALKLRSKDLLSDMKRFQRHSRTNSDYSQATDSLNTSVSSIKSVDVSTFDTVDLEDIEQELVEIQTKKTELEGELLKSKGVTWADDLLNSCELLNIQIQQVNTCRSAKRARTMLDNLKTKLSNLQSQKVMNESFKRSNKLANRLTGLPRTAVRRKEMRLPFGLTKKSKLYASISRSLTNLRSYTPSFAGTPPILSDGEEPIEEDIVNE